MKKSAAQREGNRIAAQMDIGAYKPKGSYSDNMTLGDAFDKFVEEMPIKDSNPVKERKLVNKKGRYETFGKQLNRDFKKLTKIPFGDVEPSDIIKFQNQRLNDGSANQTVINNTNMISRIYEYAGGIWQYRGINPVRLVRKAKAAPSKPKPKDRRLEAGEEEMIIEELNVRRHINWNNHRPDLKEDLAHLVKDIKRRICGIASAGSPVFSV
jgi:hypothetical protein